MKLDAIIVGGGIGGLGAAFALARKGLKVRVLEQAAEFGEVGAGIQLAPNGTRILEAYGLLEDAKALGVQPVRMLMRDAISGSELTSLDLAHLERTYGYPYLVIHRSDLHGLLLRACQGAGVDLRTRQRVTEYSSFEDGASVVLADGGVEEAAIVIAADGLHSVARDQLVGDDPVSSHYVAYRAAVPIDQVHRSVDLDEVVVHVGPGCHFVQYGLRGGDLLNQVAVFRSPRAVAGEREWGTPDELDAAFERTTADVRDGISLMWRDRCWRMFDRNPIAHWVHGRIVLLGDAAHPPLQYMAQGAIMAIEDGWVLSEHVARQRNDAGAVDLPAALAAYEAVRPEHCRRVVLAARAWGDLWHVDGEKRLERNGLLRERERDDYTYIDWIYGPTALLPSEEPPLYPVATP